MPWLSEWFHKVRHRNVDIDEIKQKLNYKTANTEDLLSYVDDLEVRINKMVKDLRRLYKKYNIIFTGFKSMDLACEYLRQSIKDGSETAYNNLIKLESMVMTEQQRHLALIRMAVMNNGKRVTEQINSDPESKEIFEEVFGVRDAAGQTKQTGAYQQIWSEIHKLAEYILLQKNKLYH